MRLAIDDCRLPIERRETRVQAGVDSVRSLGRSLPHGRGTEWLAAQQIALTPGQGFCPPDARGTRVTGRGIVSAGVSSGQGHGCPLPHGRGTDELYVGGAACMEMPSWD